MPPRRPRVLVLTGASNSIDINDFIRDSEDDERERSVASRGLPFGITFMGRAFSEPQLIGLAYALEQLTNARHAPRFLPTFTQ